MDEHAQFTILPRRLIRRGLGQLFAVGMREARHPSGHREKRRRTKHGSKVHGIT
jgi:hypothetical protein